MFHLIPTLPYKIEQTQELSNIVASVILKRVNIDKTFLYKDVIVRVDCTLESLSQQFYGDTQYWWAIQLVNNIVDPFCDLPVNNDILVELTRAKYGDENALHWFIDNRTGLICDDRSSIEFRKQWKAGTLAEYIIPVSHLDYEMEQNNARTRMKIVNPAYINTFAEVFKETVNAE